MPSTTDLASSVSTNGGISDAPAAEAGIRFDNVSHWFVTGENDVKIALEDVSFEVAEREFVAIVGASGCGKTTILNLLAGVERPSDGNLEVRLDGQKLELPSNQLGYMWARDALLPWRTLQRNVEFGLEVRGVPRSRRHEVAQRYIDLVHLNGSEDHFPRQLSQGMRQRGNLARLLATEPQVFLMDEPFSALDAQTKVMLQREFVTIWQGHPRTVVYVTHDLDEAAALADRVLIMGFGHIAYDIKVPFERPRNMTELRFTPEFTEFSRDLWDKLQVAKEASDR